MEKLALDEVLEAFRIASQRERIQFLDSLFDSFLPSEKHALQEKLRSTNYYFDIFGSLPTEISLQIAEDLDPKDIIRLCRVSLRWKFILSSPQLARKTVQTSYSKRSDLPSYARQLEEDPFSALRNIAFKEYAGESGLFKLKTEYDFSFSEIPRYKDSFFVGLNASVGLEYAIFDHIRQGSSPETYQWYLVDLNKGQSQMPILLVNKQREILDKGSAHAGTGCAAAITLSSGRAFVWNTKGGLIRGFKLLHEGDITISSSEKYLCIRNEHSGTDYSDYYLVNLQTADLRVFERITDFVKVATRESIIDSPPMMILANRIIVAAVFPNNAHKPQVAVSWLTFNEEESTLIETTAVLLDHDFPHNLPNHIPHSISFRYGMNTTGVGMPGLRTKGPNVWLTILSDGKVSTSWKYFDLNPSQYHGFGPDVTISFYYNNTVYAIIYPTDKKDLLGEKGGFHSHSLWCSGGDMSTSLGPGRILNLVDMSGRLQEIRPHDKGFAAFYEGGVHVYDWLSFDEFVALQRS
ncbi:hypothetical protein TWF506_005617 [Arthrobotrys conoides]|uniref:F-box domain-containing protein n=1 Tax=Arthrobotrys conoides TaxID=74498 RepID=A0AAN8NTY5_9PEZI